MIVKETIVTRYLTSDYEEIHNTLTTSLWARDERSWVIHNIVLAISLAQKVHLKNLDNSLVSS